MNDYLRYSVRFLKISILCNMNSYPYYPLGFLIMRHTVSYNSQKLRALPEPAGRFLELLNRWCCSTKEMKGERARD